MRAGDDSPDRAARREVKRRALGAIAQGDATGWFDEVYARAGFDPASVPWADLGPNPGLLELADRTALRGEGRPATVVGCGLGDDAEALAALGYDVTAFDVSATAVDWCRRRFPGSAVRYVVADLLDLPPTLSHAASLVFEAYTVQALPPDLRGRALSAVASLLAPGGTLVMIAAERDAAAVPPLASGPPWPLARAELSALEAAGLEQVELDGYVDADGTPRLRGVYRRSSPPG